jgi:hypothetical protein
MNIERIEIFTEINLKIGQRYVLILINLYEPPILILADISEGKDNTSGCLEGISG